ncbi:MAG: signal peptidase II [Bacteroidota bacterium]
MKKATKYFSISLAVIILDQIVKLLVKFNMDKGEAGQIKVMGDFFKLHFIENRGAAFGLTLTDIFNGMGMEMSDDTGKLILTLFSIVAVIAIGYVLYKLKDHQSALPIFVALIFGGALGNIIDRTFYGIWFADINDYSGGLFFGRVVDMFYLDIWKGYLPNVSWVPFLNGQYTALWPIWNIADASISIGIVVILLFQGRFFKKDEEARGITSDDKKEEKKEKKDTSSDDEAIDQSKFQDGPMEGVEEKGAEDNLNDEAAAISTIMDDEGGEEES